MASRPAVWACRGRWSWYDGDWHLYDPYLEIIPVNDAGEVVSLDATPWTSIVSAVARRPPSRMEHAVGTVEAAGDQPAAFMRLGAAVHDTDKETRHGIHTPHDTGRA
ncbi:MAG: hypothetical protein QE274_11645 [Verrucomicrobiaceae bacterium]|nr:hypothetical protein [Verrucomicrobiaceae bacterium]